MYKFLDNTVKVTTQLSTNEYLAGQSTTHNYNSRSNLDLIK